MSWKKHAGKYVFSFIKPKPSVGKTKLQKELFEIKQEGRKKIGKIKKDHMKSMAPLDEAHTKLRQNIQKMKGEPVTKSGLSKRKDLK
jgi:tRNA uridine 5-carbamoylmethylation protein Kti12